MPAAVNISRVDVWVAEIQDRPGALAEKLEALAQAGANLDFVIARRAPEKPGAAVVFVAPLRSARQQRAAQQAGFAKAASMHSLRVEHPDRPGIGAQITRALADAGINLRGISAASVGRRSVVYFAFDQAEDARKAAGLLRRALARKPATAGAKRRR